eukprot:jgi/Bigna1/82918/fgenesh1_pg.99_\
MMMMMMMMMMMLSTLLRESYGVSISDIKTVVLDEVDKTISIERERMAIDRLVRDMKQASKAQIVFVSASMTQDSMVLADKYMQRIKKISTLGITEQNTKFLSSSSSMDSRKNGRKLNASSPSSRLPDRISNFYLTLPERSSLRAKGDMVAKLYRALSEAKFSSKRRRGNRPGILVFVRNPANIPPLIDHLRGQYRLDVRGIDPRTNKRQLKQCQEMMSAGRLQILVGTEIMARGMDVEGVTDVCSTSCVNRNHYN